MKEYARVAVGRNSCPGGQGYNTKGLIKKKKKKMNHWKIITDFNADEPSCTENVFTLRIL